MDDLARPMANSQQLGSIQYLVLKKIIMSV